VGELVYLLYNKDNKEVMTNLTEKFILVYADMIYEDKDLSWIDPAVDTLIENGIIIIQTDYHTVAEVKLHLDSLGLIFVNWAIYKQEWGGTSKRFFPRKHDDILIYAKGDKYKFYPDRIQIPKVTAGTKFDKKGTGLKTPCDVFDDLGNFSTVSKERIKSDDKNIRWQKPLKLINRLLLPFTDEGDTVFDPFMGTSPTGVWCVENNRNFVGVECNKEIFEIAKKRIEYHTKESDDEV
jgi:site-specific DNA-methyltransferase (adenine-specific)